MNFKDLNIVFGITGAISTFPIIIKKIKDLKKLGVNIYPVMSYYAYNLSIHLEEEKHYIEQIKEITNKKVIFKIEQVKSLMDKINSDAMIIAPTTGNTIAKISNSISDTSITYAFKCHIKRKLPVTLSINADDGLSSNACNIGLLLNRKNVYIVPFRQSNPITKPYSISSDPNLIINTLKHSLVNEQLEPVIL